jgi:cellulose synthase/poly-beta-1,6-N-acetylglucosamine synthase-like glycosyltransferase
METLAWVCLGLLIFLYAGYAAVLWVLHFGIRKKPVIFDETPPLSLILTAHNEEKYISQKLENCLSLDYPKDRLEILLGLDGCTDRTLEIARSYQEKGVRLVISREWVGKSLLRDRLVDGTKNPILVFTDSNAILDKRALREIVRPFGDPAVGAVTGYLKYLPENDGSLRGEGLFKRYDNVLKRLESDLGSSVILEGSLCALRRELFETTPPETPEDLVLAMRLIKKGKKVFFCERAVSFERFAPDLKSEFKRRVRIAVRTLEGLAAHPECLDLVRYGHYAFFLWAHRVLPYCAPFSLVILFVISLFLRDLSNFWRMAFLIQTLAYALAVLYRISQNQPENSYLKRVCYPAYFFCFFNASLLVGLWQWLKGVKICRWEPNR